MDFSQYASTAALLADVGGSSAYRWNAARSSNIGQVVLDTTVGYGTLTKSMRYDWPNNGSNCLDYPITLGDLMFPGWVQVTDIWVEIAVKFSANFATRAGASGCNSDYKFFFLNTNPGGRFEIKTGTYGTPGYFSTNYPSGIQDTYTYSTPGSV